MPIAHAIVNQPLRYRDWDRQLDLNDQTIKTIKKLP
jgi:hypothetical protein